VTPLFEIETSDEGDGLQRLYDRLAARFGFGPARVRISRRKLTGGEIRYGPPHEITVSGHLSDRERRETLLHEAAHAWAFARHGARAGHGALFRRLAAQLGARGGHAPLTAALAEFRSRKRVVYRCEGCRLLFRRFRPFRRPRYCIACDRAGRPSRLRRIDK